MDTFEAEFLSEEIMADIRRRARAGSDWLSSIGYDDWETYIVINWLNMEHAERCVLGQIFGDHEKEITGWSWAITNYGLDDEELGFTIGDDYLLSMGEDFSGYFEFQDAWNEAYQFLTHAWLELIKEKANG